MKRVISIILLVLLLAALCACGKKAQTSEDTAISPASVTPTPSDIFEVKISLSNLYDYFEYSEFKSCVKGNDGSVSSVQIAYGLKLKDEYTAANDSNYTDTLKLTFTADGVINKGSYVMNYDTLEYTGETESTEHETVTHELIFWPKGNRTSIWTYGVYNGMYCNYLENFQITSASGSVFLKYAADSTEAEG